MSKRIDQKVVLITGGARGIGAACSTLLAAEGAKVAVTDILEDDGQDLVDEIRKQGHSASYWHLDVTSEDSIKSVIEAVKQEFGTISVLVNNAGIAGANKQTHEVSVEEWDHLMAINVRGVFLCSKHVLPQMIEAKTGSIVNMSSIYGLVGAPDLPPYHASKGAVRLMTKTDALIYANRGIRVNSVHPGFIDTYMVRKLMTDTGDEAGGLESLKTLHPLGTLGDPMDIAYGVLYLASDESKFVTGSELVIDGGYTAR